MTEDKYGDNFLQKSKYARGNLPRHRLDFFTMPPPYMVFSESLEKVKLPEKHEFATNDFQTVLQNRQSTRKFSNDPITLQELSTLLKYTSGIKEKFNPNQFNKRFAPSAGGLYPHETFLVVNNVDGLKKGLYHYNVTEHSLDMLKEGDFSTKSKQIGLDQLMAQRCGAVFFWVAVVPRSKWKYLQRCYRYVFMDAGHLGQNFYLVAEALNLACCTIGAIYDDEGNKFLGVDGKDESLIYMGVVGTK
ncbi:MAG: SagB/ThcOx family dehydrogenase [Candidatus Hodarchaeota archaeon]